MRTPSVSEVRPTSSIKEIGTFSGVRSEESRDVTLRILPLFDS